MTRLMRGGIPSDLATRLWVVVVTWVRAWYARGGGGGGGGVGVVVELCRRMRVLYSDLRGGVVMDE